MGTRSAVCPWLLWRHRVAVIEMRILSNVERDRATRVETDSEAATLVDLLDSTQLTVGHMLVSGELSFLQ